MKKSVISTAPGMGQALLARINTVEAALRRTVAEHEKLTVAINDLNWNLIAAKEMLHRLMRSEGGQHAAPHPQAAGRYRRLVAVGALRSMRC